MQWFVLSPDGKSGSFSVRQLTNQQDIAGGVGNLKIFAGPFKTKAEALVKAAQLNGGGTGVVTPIKPPVHIPNPLAPLAGIDAIGHFFANLTDRQTVVRIAEVLIGGGLIWIAVAHLLVSTKSGKKIASAASGAIPGAKALGKTAKYVVKG